MVRQGLSQQQQEAFDLIIGWYMMGDDHAPFVLRGYAGTGKTYCIQQVIGALQVLQPKIRIATCAPTHRAVHVLQGMADAADIQVDITTLHSLLHVMPGNYTKDGKRTLRTNEWSKEPHYSDYDLVVIDEASMVSQELMDLVEMQSAATLLMGDPAQLPPVGEDESPVFRLATGYELTDVVRSDGAIARYIGAIRSNLDAQFPPRVATQGNITKCEPEDWEGRLVEHFKASSDPLEVRAIAWTNARVNVLNKRIREAVKWVGEDEPYIEGERLVAKEPIIISSDDSDNKNILMHSCAECEVITVSEESFPVRKRMLYLFRLGVETDLGKEANILTIHPRSWDTARQIISEWKREILDMEEGHRSKAWRAYYEFLEIFNLVIQSKGIANRLSYAYATTCHQSQGGTFSNVFVDHSNIFGCRDVRMRNRLLYVADSRASQHLYICTKF